MSNTDPTRPRVAILEDHEDTRELWRITLGDEFLVHDYREAPALLSAMERERYSAVIADIMMPGMDGFSFIKTLRQDQRFQELCVVAVTALAMSGDRQKAMAAGFNDYLVKPVAPSEIVAVVRRCLAGSSGASTPAN